VPARLGADPFLQEAPISQLPAVDDLGLDLRLAGIKAQQGRDGGDEVLVAEPGGHDVRGVVLDGAVGDAALVLAQARRDQVAQQRLDDAAGRAPRCGPQGEQRGARGGGEQLVRVELVRVTNAVCLFGCVGGERSESDVHAQEDIDDGSDPPEVADTHREMRKCGGWRAAWERRKKRHLRIVYLVSCLCSGGC
jgi:hypothetical protein